MEKSIRAIKNEVKVFISRNELLKMLPNYYLYDNNSNVYH